jgi:uncharacterized membrane protein YcaP (DUF421 family)
VVITSVTADDRSLTNCFSAVVTIGLMHRFVSCLRQRFPQLGKLIDGTPLLLVKDGQWQTETMGAMRIQDTDVVATTRTKGLRSPSQVKYAVLERNGAISIFPKDD